MKDHAFIKHLSESPPEIFQERDDEDSPQKVINHFRSPAITNSASKKSTLKQYTDTKVKKAKGTMNKYLDMTDD